jgi:hypothetical protein
MQNIVCVKVDDELSLHVILEQDRALLDVRYFFLLFINDLVTCLYEKCNRNIFVSNDIEMLITLMSAL